MATLQVRDINDELYSNLKVLAEKEHRSISQEVIKIIESYIQSPEKKLKDITQDFLTLSGSWQDNRNSEEIIKDIRHSRKNSNRLGKNYVVFD
jgi:plasmid stability protein